MDFSKKKTIFTEVSRKNKSLQSETSANDQLNLTQKTMNMSLKSNDKNNIALLSSNANPDLNLDRLTAYQDDEQEVGYQETLKQSVNDFAEASV